MNSAPDPSPVTVLLVDDQERFRAVARTVIERTPHFHLVGEAADGEEAVTQFRALRPSLTLMDIHMPGVDGIDATKLILTEHPGAVIVLLSSYDRSDLPAGTMESGALAYLHKEELASGTLAELWRGRGGSLGAEDSGRVGT